MRAVKEAPQLPPPVWDALRAARALYDRVNTLTLVSHGPDGVWAGKVFFAEHEGDLYVALEQGRNYRNLMRNPRVFFVIERGVPDRFIQGEGVAEPLGPVEERPERHILFRRALGLVPFAKAFPGVTLFRIRPTRLYISDYTGDWKPRTEVVVDEAVREAFRTVLRGGTPRWKVLWQAVRPFSFTVTLFSVLMGALMAPRTDPGLLLATLVGALLVHAGVNVLSDHVDYRRGADTWRVLGSSRVLVDGLMDVRAHLRWGVLLLALGAGVGVALALLRTPLILGVGLAGGLIGLFYTAPPLGLKYRGLGDLAVFLAFGPLMALGAYLVQTGRVDWGPVWVAVPLGLLTAAVLHGNNFRDIAEDRGAGYRTLAGLLGARASAFYYLALVAGAYVSVVVLVAVGLLPWPALLVFLSVHRAWKNLRVAFRPQRVAFTFLDLMTALLHFQFGLALVVGLALGRWLLG